MNPVRLLGKMTTKGLRLDGGGGGPVLIAPGDVAAALAMGGLPHEAVLVGLAKYADDNNSQLALRDWARAHFRRRCVVRGWKQDYAEGLALLVVYELVNPTRCPECAGRGKRWESVDLTTPLDVAPVVGRSWEYCSRCKGTGTVRLSQRDRAAIAGITKTTFCDTWSRRADELWEDLATLEDRVLRHLWHHFSDQAA
ncbi:hypothetical protein ACEK07_04450 [Alcanivoracaceae bacterium MT1]